MKTVKISPAISFIGIIVLLIVGCATVEIAGGPISPGSLKDGIYRGTAKNGPAKVEANVAIQNQRITEINLIEHRSWKGKAAEGIIPERIINQQSTKVDAVSGATASSKAIMNAVEAAVRKAR